MLTIYGTNATDYIQEKLGFVEDFAHGNVEVRVKDTKSTDLRVASITYKLKGHKKPVNITTEEHRAVAKCIDELADLVRVKISRDQDKYEARRNNERRKVAKAKREREEELINSQLDLKELKEELVE